jgi:tetratricopeptide (TPR) repeat protein
MSARHAFITSDGQAFCVRLSTGASLALALSSVSCGVPPPQPTPTVTAIAVLQGIADSGRDLPRPPLSPGADTNSAAAYYARGVELVQMSANLDTAEMALYWASRLDPSWAEPFFLRGLAMLRAVRKDALDAFRRTGSVRAARQLGLDPRQLQRVDSLFHIAWGRNPFLFCDLDTPPFWGGFRDPSNRAAVAFTAGRFAQAETLFTEVLRHHPDNVLLRIYRARALFYLGRYDDGVVELEAVRDTVRRKAEGFLSAVRPSVSMLEFAIGIARVQQDDFPAARAAFDRALNVDLSFYWAHARLAGSALALHDTATALSELKMAIRLEASDPVLRLYDGVVLHGAERQDEAAGQLRRAIELDPYYAEPYYWLAGVYRAQHKVPEAIQQYREFLSHAPREDPKRAAAVRDVAALVSLRGDSS